MRDRLRTATKADLVVLLERIEEVVDTSFEGDALMRDIRRIKREFELNRDLNDPVNDIPALTERLETLKYAELFASQPNANATRSVDQGGVVRDRPQ